MDSALTAFPALPPERRGAPRSVVHLAFPEILVVWALRRYTSCRLSREARTTVIAPAGGQQRRSHAALGIRP